MARPVLRLRPLHQRSAQLLTKRHGARARMLALLARLQCSQCGSPPAKAEWIDNPAGGAFGSGYPPKRRVPLGLPSA